MKYYMHLLDGQPAHFDGEQICFNRTGRYGTRTSHPLARDLEQIKIEQMACRAFRLLHNFGYTDFEYSYCTVDTPDQNSGGTTSVLGEHCEGSK